MAPRRLIPLPVRSTEFSIRRRIFSLFLPPCLPVRLFKVGSSILKVLALGTHVHTCAVDDRGWAAGVQRVAVGERGSRESGATGSPKLECHASGIFAKRLLCVLVAISRSLDRSAIDAWVGRVFDFLRRSVRLHCDVYTRAVVDICYLLQP